MQGGAMAEAKVVVLGDKGVGKTCLVMRYIQGIYVPKQQSTIGAFFLTKKVVTSDGSTFKMQLWDTAGQERFRAMAPMYYRGSAAAIVCYDVTNEESFSKMKDWVEELSNNVPTDELILVIASNKIDLHEERVVSRTRVEEFAAKVKAHLFETSAKDNIGVDDMFRRIGEEIVARDRDFFRTPTKTGNRKVSSGPSTSVLSSAKDNQSGGCCFL